MHPDWARSLRGQCKAAGVPFLFKQWGEWAWVLSDDDEDEPMPPGSAPQPMRVGKAAAGRRLDGVEHNEFPEARR
jgi:protein gp37